MFQFSLSQSAFLGDDGSLPVLKEDTTAYKFAMLLEGECFGLGPTAAAAKYEYTRQRYFQLLHAYRQQGILALRDQTRGPKTHYRRTDELVRQVIRHRFLDPEASAQVIAQKLTQTEHPISLRSVHRVIADYGLQKKTLHAQPQSPAAHRPHPAHAPQTAPRTGRPAKPGAPRPPVARR